MAILAWMDDVKTGEEAPWIVIPVAFRTNAEAIDAVSIIENVMKGDHLGRSSAVGRYVVCLSQQEEGVVHVKIMLAPHAWNDRINKGKALSGNLKLALASYFDFPRE